MLFFSATPPSDYVPSPDLFRGMLRFAKMLESIRLDGTEKIALAKRGTLIRACQRQCKRTLFLSARAPQPA